MVQVARFDGAGDRATTADSAVVRAPSTAVTVAGWVYLVTFANAWHAVVGKEYSGGSPFNSYAVYRDESASQLAANIANGTTFNTTSPVFAGGIDCSTGQWYFFALTWQSGGTLTYRMWNTTPTLIGTDTGDTSSTAIGYNTGALYVGGNPGGEDANIRIGCLGIHNAVLTDAQLITDADSWFNTGRPPVQLAGPFYSFEGDWAPDTTYGNASAVALTPVGNATFEDLTVPWTPPSGAITASGAPTEADDTSAGSGALPGGAGTPTEADDTSAGSGTSSPPPTVTQSLWDDTVTPTIETGDSTDYSLGTQFSSDIDGDITHLRYYEPAGLTASITLYLRSAAGASLASVEHTQQNLGAADWVDVELATPYAITAGTTYKVCYDHPSFNSAYAANVNYFDTSYSNGDNLTAPVTAGQYAQTALDANPTQDYNNSNYWADVILATAAPVSGSGSPTEADDTSAADGTVGDVYNANGTPTEADDTSAGTATHTPPPTPPTVTAGPSRPVGNSGSVPVEVVATPPGGETITGYQWTQVSGPAGSFTNDTSNPATFNAPASGTGTAVVRCTVTASNGGEASDDIDVVVDETVIAAENSFAGTASSTWDDVVGAGDLDLQGFADGYSVNVGDTISFKIADFDGAGWTADVYRLGYYGGDGARLYDSLTPTAQQETDSQSQPAALDLDPDTTLKSADCSNWDVTLTWDVPDWTPSGVFVLRLNQTGTNDSSHVYFIVRDDNRAADIMLKTADQTWHAYSWWDNTTGGYTGGNTLYYATGDNQYSSDRANRVSYNRPLLNRGSGVNAGGSGSHRYSCLFGAEYTGIRFLERNGYDVKYYGCIDAETDATGALLSNVQVAISIGHDEYWGQNARDGWEAARDTHGVNLIFWSGNEVFWRTRPADIDGNGRARTVICYKDTIPAGINDPTEWTGTWRDSAGAGNGGDNPENLLTGTIFVVNGVQFDTLDVPFAYKDVPLWRGITNITGLTSGQTWSSPSQILGFEWDTYAPAGVDSPAANYIATPNSPIEYCSETSSTGLSILQDAGQAYATDSCRHRLVMYQATSGALVFGAGTCNWSWGLDSYNTNTIGSNNVSAEIQQATVNLLADMGAQPGSLMGTLSAATLTEWFPPSATGTPTEADDTSAASGTVTAPSVTASATPTEADDASAAAGVLSYAATATPTEADDTSTAAGVLAYTATSTPAEADDTSTAAGVLAYPGSGTPTEADDTSAAAGVLSYAATGTPTEGDDTSAATGGFSAAEFTAAGSPTEADDTSAASGTVTEPTYAGSGTPTEADDTSAGAGVLSYTATGTPTEADDTSAGAGAQANNVGSSSTTEADDTSAAAATSAIVGSLSVTEDDDGSVALAQLAYVGALSVTQEDQAASQDVSFEFGTWVGTTLPDRWTSSAHPSPWVAQTFPARRWPTGETRLPRWLTTTRSDRWSTTAHPQRFVAHTRTPKWLTTTIYREGATVALTTVALGPYTQNEVPEPLLIRVLETRRDDTTAGKELYNQSPAWVVTAYIDQPDATQLTRSCTILDPSQLTTLYPDDFSTAEEGWVQMAWAQGDLDQLTGSGYQIQLGLNNGTLLLKSTTVWSVEVNDAAAAAVTLV